MQAAFTDQTDPTPRFTLDEVTDVLWTLTDRCNLACSYCAVVPHHCRLPPEPSAEEVDHVLRELGKLPSLESLILSGGEALLSPHLARVLEGSAHLAPARYLITNGTTLSTERKALLLAHRPRVMITIDSMDEQVNRQTRGEGVLARTLATLRWLIAEEFFVVVILVFTRDNADSMAFTLESLLAEGVKNILIQQLHCSDAASRVTFLERTPSHAQLRALSELLTRFKEQHPEAQIDDNEVCFFESRERAIQKKCSPSLRYHPQRLFMCGAGYNFFALKANGDVIPCNAFLDCVVGNIHHQGIDEILLSSPQMRGLRNLREHRVDVIEGCRECSLNPLCDGGCRADAYNLTGEIGSAHPNCPRIGGSMSERP